MGRMYTNVMYACMYTNARLGLRRVLSYLAAGDTGHAIAHYENF